MRKLLTVVACVGVALAFGVGCVVPMGVGPSAVSQAMIYTDVTYPSAHEATTQYNLERKDFDILGPASGECESTIIVGMVSMGDGGIQKAIQNACAKMGADDLIDIKVDTHVMSILGWIYAKVTTRVHGTAIKRK